MKIIMLGPVYPYKGGIAHYTSLMTNALMKAHQVHVFSFKYQYPSFLYPGKEQIDYENDSFKIENTEYILHSLNFFSWFGVISRIKNIDPDLVFFQWWNPFFSPLFTYIAKRVKRKLKKRTMALAHNALPHEKIPFDRFLAKRFFKFIDKIILQSQEDVEKLLELKPGADFIKAVHPTYNVFKMDNKTLSQARNELNLSNTESIMLFFGFVREYKGLKTLIESMPLILQKVKNIRLLVVGDFYSGKEDYLSIIQSQNLGEYISIYDGYIPDNEVGTYFQASDLVVLPYYSATQSGIVQIAYGFEKPVIVTNVGGLPEVVDHGKTGFVVKPRDSEDLANYIIKYFELDNNDTFIENIQAEKEKYSWDKMVEIINSIDNENN